MRSQAAVGFLKYARGRRGCAGKMRIGLQACEELRTRYVNALSERLITEAKQNGNNRDVKVSSHRG